MSKVLGLDIASSTGWCILENDQLVKYGVITLPSEMNLFQRIKYFEHNLQNILNENKPDEVHIEDVILGISGAKTLAYLGRLNGVAILTCFNVVGDKIKLYQPTNWKAHSFPNLNGMAKKAEIQIAVIKHFKLISEEELNALIKPLTEFNSEDQTLKDQLDQVKKTIETCKKIIGRKTASDNDKSNSNNLLKEKTKQLNELKKIVSKRKKEIENVYKQVSISLTAKCGLTSDVSDSIGIAFCKL